VDKFSMGLGFGYSSGGYSSSNYSITTNSYRLIANGKFYLYDFNPNLYIYTETNGGFIFGDRVTGGGTLFTPGPLSTTPRSDFLFAQKIGFEARYAKSIVFNIAWGVFYESMETSNSPFLSDLFKNSFIPLAIDLLIGYSF
jgi:hypothetical protein